MKRLYATLCTFCGRTWFHCLVKRSWLYYYLYFLVLNDSTKSSTFHTNEKYLISKTRVEQNMTWQVISQLSVDRKGSRDSAVRVASYVGWVYCWFSSLLRGFYSGFSSFPQLFKNQHFVIPIRSGIRILQVFQSQYCKMLPSLNKVDLFT